MRSIWESLSRLVEVKDDDYVPTNAHMRRIMQRAKDKMAQQPKSNAQKEDEPEADSLPGSARFQGAPGMEPEDLPKPDQPAPQSGIGLAQGRLAARKAEPTSVDLGARARQVAPGVSGIKQKFGVSPDAFFGDVPMKRDPQSGKMASLRGRPKKDGPQGDETELVNEPFADVQARAMAKATTPGKERQKPTSYDAGAWSKAMAHLPKGGEIRQGGKGQNVGSSTAGGSKLTATGGVRAPDFHGQKFAPAGHTAADEEEWEQNPALAARRLGGNTGKKLSYGMDAVGQRGRMGLPAKPGQQAGLVGNKHTGEWQSPEEFDQFNRSLRAKLAAKLAMRGADAANQGRRPHASAAQAPGRVIPKDANSQKADARASAIASKPLGVNTRRDPEAKGPAPDAAEPTQVAPSGGQQTQPIDREKLKKMIAARLAAKAGEKK